jgi:hypothetical protein
VCQQNPERSGSKAVGKNTLDSGPKDGSTGESGKSSDQHKRSGLGASGGWNFPGADTVPDTALFHHPQEYAAERIEKEEEIWMYITKEI